MPNEIWERDEPSFDSCDGFFRREWSLAQAWLQRVDCRTHHRIDSPRPCVYTPTLLDLPRARATLCGRTICSPSPSPCNYSKPRAAAAKEREQERQSEHEHGLMHEPLKNRSRAPIISRTFHFKRIRARKRRGVLRSCPKWVVVESLSIPPTRPPVNALALSAL